MRRRNGLEEHLRPAPIHVNIHPIRPRTHRFLERHQSIHVHVVTASVAHVIPPANKQSQSIPSLFAINLKQKRTRRSPLHSSSVRPPMAGVKAQHVRRPPRVPVAGDIVQHQNPPPLHHAHVDEVGRSVEGDRHSVILPQKEIWLLFSAGHVLFRRGDRGILITRNL